MSAGVGKQLFAHILHNLRGSHHEVDVMPSGVQLPPLLAGPESTMRRAAGRVLSLILPGSPLVVELIGRMLDAAATGAGGPMEVEHRPACQTRDILLIQQIVNTLADELPAVLHQAAAMPQAAAQALDLALFTEAACLGGVQKIDKLAQHFAGLDEELSRRWNNAASQPHWADVALPLLLKTSGIADFVADLRAAALGQPKFTELVSRFRNGLAVLSEGDASRARDILGALVGDGPTSAAAALALATALVLQGQWDEAKRPLARAAQLRPTDPDLMAICRKARADGQSLDEAMKPIEQGASSKPRPVVVLSIIGGPHEGTRFQVDPEGPIIVGRAPTANLALVNDTYLSRHHFLLEAQPPNCYLRDLGSGNGTRVNGRGVVEYYLCDGDVVSAGETRLRFDLVTDPGLSTVSQGSVLEVDTGTAEMGTPDLPEPFPSAAVPGYEIIGLLGEGGMGHVYLARSERTKQQVAVKIIRPDLAGSHRTMKRFLREINVLRSLDHPHIVRFHEMGTVGNQFFFAMEYVRTIDLKKLLAGQSADDRIRICCDIACQVLEGLGYAHARGFIHRDVKPPNILVSGQYPRLLAHLADFGLAKNLQSSGLSAMTFDREILGTLPFIAPEQVVDSRRARPGVDIYSLGATLYRLLSDQAPFDLKEHKNPPAAILEDEPIPLIRWCPWLPPALAGLVHKALAKDPANRFASALEMRSALLFYARPPAPAAATVRLHHKGDDRSELSP